MLVADGLRLQLESLGHEVVAVVRDGHETLAAARALEPDMLLLDIRMPKLDGVRVCERVMHESPLPVVMVTGYGDHQLIAQAEAAGAAGYMLKPVDERQLDAAIALARARFRASAEPDTVRGASERAGAVPKMRAESAGTGVAGAGAIGATETGQVRVLVIEPHLLFAEALSAVLDVDPEIDVVGTETDTRASRERARLTAPNVVLLDYALMTSVGSRFAADLRGEFPAIRIVVLASSIDEEALFSCIQAGAVGCLTKDRPPAELVDAIKRVYAGEVLFAPDLLVSLLTRSQGRSQAANEPQRPNQPLGERERQVLQTLATGMSTEEVAAQLGITVHTVRTHLKNILAKLRARSKLEAVIFGLQQGLIVLPK